VAFRPDLSDENEPGEADRRAGKRHARAFKKSERGELFGPRKQGHHRREIEASWVGEGAGLLREKFGEKEKGTWDSRGPV